MASSAGCSRWSVSPGSDGEGWRRLLRITPSLGLGTHSPLREETPPLSAKRPLPAVEEGRDPGRRTSTGWCGVLGLPPLLLRRRGGQVRSALRGRAAAQATRSVSFSRRSRSRPVIRSPRSGAGPATSVRSSAGAGHSTERGHADHRVVGVDLSPAMATLASRRLDAALVADMRSLPLATGACGGLLAFYSLIHLRREELVPTLAELRRLLRPGGRVLFSAHEGEDEIGARRVPRGAGALRGDTVRTRRARQRQSTCRARRADGAAARGVPVRSWNGPAVCRSKEVMP